jgi:cysteine synthase
LILWQAFGWHCSIITRRYTVLKHHNADVETIIVEPAQSAVLSAGEPVPHKIVCPGG